MYYKKVRPTRAINKNWVRVLILFAALIIVAVIAANAYVINDSEIEIDLYSYEHNPPEEEGGHYYIGEGPEYAPNYADIEGSYGEPEPLSYEEDGNTYNEADGYYEADGYINEAPGYIGIMPLNIYADAIINHPSEIQGAIDEMVSPNAQRTLRFNFNTITTTTLPEVEITGDRHVIIVAHVPADNPDDNPRWNQHMSAQRHFRISNGARLDIGDVTLSREDGFGPLPSSGGIFVVGDRSDPNDPDGRIRSRLDIIHANAVISNNRSSEGGGIRIEAAIFNMHGGSVINNIASSGGGGIQTDLGTLTIYGGLIAYNTGGFGGGIHVRAENTSLTLHDGTVRNNHSTAEGGGLRIVNGPTFYMYGGTVRNNTTGSGGGGGGVGVTSNLGHLGSAAVGTVFIMRGGVIEENNAPRGGGVLVGGGATFTMEYGPGGSYGTIRNNRTTNNNLSANLNLGGGVFVRDGEYDDGVFTRSVFNFSAGVIESNRAVQGGGIYLMERAMVTMSGGHIRNNRYRPTVNNAIAEGGGVWIGSELSTFEFTGGIIGHADNLAQGNIAERGGGIFIGNGGGFVMVEGNGRVAHNQAVGAGAAQSFGGGIYATDPVTFLNIGAGIVEENTARNGGGVAVTNNANFSLFGTGDVTRNLAFATAGQTANGGGVFASTGSTFNLAAGHTITANIARATGVGAVANGGAVVLDGNIFNMGNGASISGNRAEAFTGGTANGGGLAMLSGNFTLQTGRILSGNFAEASGAASTAQGGGLAVLGGSFVTEINISGNTATATGGGTVNGGGAMVGGGTFSMAPNTSIIGNIAEANGGGIINGGGLAVVGGMFNLINTNTITDNTSTAVGGTINGGGAAVLGGVFNMTGGDVYANNATFGGGVFVSGSTAALNMSGGSIGGATPAHANTASNGGGVWVGNQGSFNMDDGMIANNIATSDTTNTAADARGGGVHVRDGSTFHMNGGDIHNNTAEATAYGDIANMGAHADAQGGGVYVNHSNFVLDGGRITQNLATATSAGSVGARHAMANGGGVHINNDTLFIMEDGVIEENRAIGSNTTSILAIGRQSASGGGGVGSGMWGRLGGNPNTPGGTMIMNGGYIRNNIADAGGGAVIARGGGVYFYRGFFEITDGTIDGNRAFWGGGVALNGSEFLMVGGTVSNHRYTGDMVAAQWDTDYIDRGGGMYARGVPHNGQTLGSLVTIDGDALIYNNYASSTGGGILIRDAGLLEMRAGRIANNEAGGSSGSGSGGGVAVTYFAAGGAARQTFTMSGGLIEDNSAVMGGGVFIADSALFQMTSEDAQIINNHAIEGGGVWLGADPDAATSQPPTELIMSAGLIADNTAEDTVFLGTPMIGRGGAYLWICTAGFI